jgi:LAO/AO transport system kinase
MTRFGLAGGPAEDTLPPSLDGLLADFRQGREGALARAISIVEGRRPGAIALLGALSETAPRPTARLGVTGPPGAGKSTLAAALAGLLSARGERVGILAVDPSSALTGGALLGDRIRMGEAVSSGVFVRSMASRGSMGGLGEATDDVLEVMEAFGFDWIVVETVGTGQIEAEVADATDSLVLVLVPESGDTVQAMKAGIAELADVIAVNKADRPGAEGLARDIRQVIELRSPVVSEARGQAPSGEGEAWVPPVVLTEATTAKGADEILLQIDRHRTHMTRQGELERRRRRRALARVRGLLEAEIRRRADDVLGSPDLSTDAARRILDGSATPRSVAQEMLGRVLDRARPE